MSLPESVTEWYIPYPREVIPALRANGYSTADLSEATGDEWAAGGARRGAGYRKMRRAVEQMRVWGIDVAYEWHLPTPEEIDQEREKRGISKSLFSELLGYSRDSWGVVINRETDPPMEKFRRARYVFLFHNNNGYVPTPGEVEQGAKAHR